MISTNLLKTSFYLTLASVAWCSASSAAPLPLSTPSHTAVYAPVLGDQPMLEDLTSPELSADLRRQIVSYQTGFAAGTVVIDTANTYLYYVLGNGQAIRYGIGVGREGFTWSGAQTVSRKAEWPDWTPPSEMIARQPYLARWMAGGEGNPLGARAMYLGSTVYRIHGTNMPSTIGERVSSGCIRMLNADVIDLYDRVNVGTKIVVLPNTGLVAAVTAPRSQQR